MSQTVETRAFEAEVSQLLRLMIHSIYSNQEVFLRELISNASDAIDKLRFEALSDGALLEGAPDFAIEVEVDAAARTVVVRDNGIGMSRQEVADNIGTIARSGTRQFLESLTGDQKKDAHQIGQFGVGFYSAFIVAERVVLTTRRAGQEEAVRWESTGEGEYQLSQVESAPRGTEIVLHLREEADEFLKAHRLEQIIRRYSDHISFPIFLIDKGAEEEEEEADARRQINQASALWTRPESEITDEEYESFYKHVAHAFDEPLARVHSHVEGLYQFSLLLFVPTETPLELRLPGQEEVGGVKLYVKRVFVLDDAQMFLPHYLRFIRGVVDSDDLPLNVSREMLQENRVVTTIRKNATKRVLDLLKDLSQDEEKYQKFWASFGAILKEGIVEDLKRQQDVAKLLRFRSTKSAEEAPLVSFADYKERMQPGQKAIYYVTADSFEAALASPHLEIFEHKGVEVLVLTDRVDEWVAAHLQEFDETPLRPVDRGALELDELGGDEAQEDSGDEDEVDEQQQAWEPVLKRVKEALGEGVRQVRLSKRLTDSPSCLVREEWEMGARMRRILTDAGEEVPTSAPTLELNPDHRLVKRLHDVDDEELARWSQLFLEQAHLSEGATLESPALFVRRLNKLMEQLIGDDDTQEESAAETS